MMGRQGRRRKQLADDLKETKYYWKLKQEALDRTLWRTRFGNGCGLVVRQIAERINYTRFTNVAAGRGLETHGLVSDS